MTQPFDVFTAGPYNALYIVGFLLAFLLAAWEGRRRGWPWLPWLALLAVCVAGGIGGSKLLHFDLHAAGPGEKSILGGLAGGVFALLVTQRFLRLQASPSAVLVPAALLGFALGRVGCFLAGCCFGRPTALPWGTVYGPESPAYAAQLEGGLIGAEALNTLPVHPTQLFEAALALLLAAALWRWGARFTRRASPAVALGVGYGLIRFGIEFLRADGAELYGGLKPVQWTVLITAAVLAVVLVWREWQARRPARLETPGPHDVEPVRVLVVLAVILAVVVLGAGWLTPLERIVVVMALVPGALLFLWEIPPPHRWLGVPGMAAAGLILVAPLPDTIPKYPYSYVTGGGGAMIGSYVETCGSARRYQVGGASVGYTRVTGPSTRYSVTGRAFVGRDRLVDSNHADPLDVLGLGLIGRADTRYIGVGLGGMAGSLPVDGDASSSLLPSASLRLGRLDRFFVEGRLLDQDPVGVPAPIIQLGIGFGIDERDSTLRLGVSDAGFYGGGHLVTSAGLEVNPFIAFGDADTYQIGLSLSHRFGSGASHRRR